MRIDIRLKRLLQEAGLDVRGITQRIADDLGLHRHTIGKLYRNRLSHPSLRVIEKVCDWLKEHGVRATLPQDLFGVRPSELWEALSALSSITLYIGEYVEFPERGAVRHWVATRDVEAWARIVAALTGEAGVGQAQLKLSYVPFRYGAARRSNGRALYEEDKCNAVEVFSSLLERPNCCLVIGSQRVNYLLEVFVADLFSTEPFRPVAAGQEPQVPFYLFWGEDQYTTPSCFGGSDLPAQCGESCRQGLCFVAENGKWECFPCVRGLKDAAVIVTVYYPGTEACHVALFGFSGTGTYLAAEKLCTDPHMFWPPEVQAGERLVRVSLCMFESKEGGNLRERKRRSEVTCVVRKLREGVLLERLRGR